MDGHDRKKLSANEIARQEYLNRHGSFLYCVERDTLCVHMDGMWLTGCERETCILDDPEYQSQQRIIAENRRRNEEENRRQRVDEKNAAPIRDQRNRIRSYVDMKMREIHRLEEDSARAYHENKPGKGDALFNKARYMRGELQKYEEELKKRGEGNDRQSDQEDHGRDDENRRSAGTAGGRAPDGEMYEYSGSREAARAREILKRAAPADMGRGAEA